jgi:hypothetical protein
MDKKKDDYKWFGVLHGWNWISITKITHLEIKMNDERYHMDEIT